MSSENSGLSYYRGGTTTKSCPRTTEPLRSRLSIRGAALCVFLASKESDGITGKLISAVWDPWEELAQHRDDLHGDVFSLRRIVPKDRGLNWGNR